MTPIEAAIEQIYTSLERNNEGIDTCIAALKVALNAAGTHTVTLNPERLAQNNRQGRRLLQTYFKKRGVVVTFAT